MPVGVGSALWAVGVPVVTVVFAVGGLYLTMWFAVVGLLLTATVAGLCAGMGWNRAGAGTLAAVGVMALGLFAGPVAHDTYLKQYGTMTDALVVDTAKEHDGHGRDVCRVVDASGKVRDLGNTENCYAQFTRGQHVVLFEDPIGNLKPWIEAAHTRTLDTTGLATTAGLFAATGGLMLYAGLRRRTDQQVAQKKQQRRRAPAAA
ncbi:hypothetical protein [Streptomyces sp. NRRL F-5123]|uniref:hypothetical protein n=1 Tax=Streptomyces sp. NRRL F-5123 TaxID=1463856 RepID=UPI0004E20CC6|nr:hypothetical protein [Streptomyces sp. NRRL F-5123]